MRKMFLTLLLVVYAAPRTPNAYLLTTGASLHLLPHTTVLKHTDPTFTRNDIKHSREKSYFYRIHSAKDNDNDMRFLPTLTLAGLLLCTPATADRRSTKAARAVIERATGRTDLPVRLTLREGDSTYFAYEVRNGVLRLEGSSGTALCRGFYDYVKRHCGGVHTWSGSNLHLPSRLPDEGKRRTVSPFAHHYYMNVVTFGYSTPYWD